MNDVEALLNINYIALLSSIVIVLLGFKGIVTLFEWVCVKFGIELRYMREKREEHELLINTVKGLKELEKQHIVDIEESNEHDKEIREELSKLTEMFISDSIASKRWEILNFASALSRGEKFSREQFAHVIDEYTKYEKILEENKMENGRVTTAMEVINEVYKEMLKSGF